MRGGPGALAVVVAAGIWVAILGETVADAPGDAQPQPAPESGQSRQQPQSAPKPEDGAQKPEKPDDKAPKSRLVSILGREVTNREGDAGRVIDVLVDLDGHSGAVVVEFGGFMGIGSRKVAVDWSALRLVREGGRTAVVVDISREQIRDAAEYKPGEPPSVLGIK